MTNQTKTAKPKTAKQSRTVKELEAQGLDVTVYGYKPSKKD